MNKLWGQKDIPNTFKKKMAGLLMDFGGSFILNKTSYFFYDNCYYLLITIKHYAKAI